MVTNPQINSLQDCKSLADLRDALQHTHSYIGKTGGRYCHLTMETITKNGDKVQKEIELGSISKVIAKFEELVLNDTSEAWQAVGLIKNIKNSIKKLDAEASTQLKNSSWLLQALTEAKHTLGTLGELDKEWSNKKLDSIMTKSTEHFENEFNTYKKEERYTAYFKLCNALLREYDGEVKQEWIFKHYEELSKLYAEEHRFEEAGNVCMVAATRMMMANNPQKAAKFYVKALNQYLINKDEKAAIKCCHELSSCYHAMKDTLTAKQYEAYAERLTPTS